MAHVDTVAHEEPELKRTLGLFAITAFGVGDILGSGVYALVGKISGQVGSAAWLAYVAAGFTAALTGLTYAEFTSRYPKAGGAAHFVQTVFRSPLITFLVMCFVGPLRDVLHGRDFAHLLQLRTSWCTRCSVANQRLPASVRILARYRCRRRTGDRALFHCEFGVHGSRGSRTLHYHIVGSQIPGRHQLYGVCDGRRQGRFSPRCW